MEFTENQKLYAEVVQKAWEDAAFKKELQANPVEAIEKLTGKRLNIPEGKTMVVRDQTEEDTVYINIPAKPQVDAELKEEDLEAVAGGRGIGLTPPIFDGPGWPGPIICFPPSPTVPIPSYPVETK